MKRAFVRALACMLCLVLLSGALPGRAADVRSDIKYDLFITSVRVTEENRGDILGDGVFRFDGERTLVVRGDCADADLPVVSNGIPDLVIRVQADSVLSSIENPAVVSFCDLAITGPGRLTLRSATNCGAFLRGCSATISHIELRAEGRWGIAGEEITDEKGQLRVIGADIDAEGTDGAVCDFARGITLTGCAVTAPSDFVLGDYAVKTADMRIARSVCIRHTGAMAPPEPYTHTVTFVNTRGDDPAPQTVEDGSCAFAPTGLTAPDAAFQGWCSDPECTSPFDFSSPISENRTLYSAWTCISGQTADKTQLLAAIREGEALSPGNYTEASEQLLQAALTQAGLVAKNEAAGQEEADAAVALVRSAISALVPKRAEIDRSALAQVVSAAEAVDPAAYTEQSMAVLRAALAAARAALDSGDQAVTDAVANTLLAALGALEEAPTPLADQIPAAARSQAAEAMEQFGCIPVPGGDIYTSELEAGKSYFFWDSVRLHVDADIDCPTLYVFGNLQIDGDRALTSEILYADGVLTVLSGSILCPEMDHPPEGEGIVRNGVTGLGGVELHGGVIRCPVISSGGETVTVIGGEVEADTVSAMFGYTQKGGTVKAENIWAREGFSVHAGTLHLGSAHAQFFWFYGGVITISGTLSYDSEAPQTVEIAFPMYIALPEGGTYADGRFLDKDGSPADAVRLEARSVTHPFRDVEWDAFYYDAMVWAYEHDPRITDGTTHNTFSPHATCTRGQVVTFLWRAQGCPEPKTRTNPFADVKEGSFYYKAVLWAVENGITNGVDAAHFGPNRSCTRAQVVTFLWRTERQPKPQSDKNPFVDVSNGYYYDAVAWAVEKNITKGTDAAHFSPNATCQRGQVVTFLHRAATK